MAPHQIHVAVLDTDVPCLSVYAQRGLYSSQFRVLLQAAAERLNKDAGISLQNGPLNVHVTAFDAVGGSLPPLETLRTTPSSPTETSPTPLSPIDAILITGSVCSALDTHPWISELSTYVKLVHATFPHVKLFGSCFGHQIIAQSLLSEPSATIAPQSTFHVEYAQAGFEVGIQPITLQPSFSAYFPPLARAAAQKPFRIQLIHGDQVVPTPEAAAAAAATGTTVALPAPWINMGSSAVCPIQGLYNPGRILTYQGHFEFDTWHNSELNAEFGRRKNWPAETVKSYLEQINRSFVAGQDDDDDSKAAAEAVLLFFAGEDRPEKAGFVRQGDGLITPPLE